MGESLGNLGAGIYVCDTYASTVSSVVAFGLAMAYVEPSWWGTMQQYLRNCRVEGQR